MAQSVDKSGIEAAGPDGVGGLAAHLTDRLVAAITSGELEPGAKLSEPELAGRFGTSRGPLREALQRLEAMRLVEHRPRQGARVAVVGPRELADLYAVREALEGMACRLAASRVGPAEVAELRALLVAHERRPDVRADRGYFPEEAPADFHFRVVQASGNPELVAVLDALYHRVRLYRYRSSHIHRRPRRALKEHHQILDAIEAGDGELAEILMRRHIGAARASVEAEFGEPADPPARGRA
jgi:DNA-binding GntR family transcriptional regulator